MSADIEPVKVNIAEHDGWAKYDTARDLEVHNNAWDMFVAYRDVEAGQWIRDLIGARGAKSKKDWSPKTLSFTSEEMSALVVALKKRSLETASQMVLDVMGYAWEEAYTPTDRNVKNALDEADEEVLEELTFYEPDEELWGPLFDAGWAKDKIVGQLLDTVRYEREADHFDRFLVFDFGEAEAVKLLIKDWRKHPPVDINQVVRLNGWLRDLSDAFVTAFFKRLDKEMENVDVSGRVDFEKSWKDYLTLNPGEVKKAKEEMTEFLKEFGHLGENQSRLIAIAILSKADARGHLTAEAAADIFGDGMPEQHHGQTVQEAARTMGFSFGQIERYIDKVLRGR